MERHRTAGWWQTAPRAGATPEGIQPARQSPPPRRLFVLLDLCPTTNHAPEEVPENNFKAQIISLTRKTNKQTLMIDVPKNLSGHYKVTQLSWTFVFGSDY